MRMHLSKILPAVIIIAALTHAAAPGMELPYAADVNADGVVNILDLIHVRNHIGRTPGSACPYFCDANTDGRVNILDLIAVRNNLGSLPRHEYLFDFGTPDSPLQPGALRVTATTDYSAETGYGWFYPADRSFLWAEDRRWDDPLGSDFIGGNKYAKFRVDLPPGAYEVEVTAAYVGAETSMRYLLNNTHARYCHPEPGANDTVYIDWTLDTSRLEVGFINEGSDLWGVAGLRIKIDPVNIVLNDVHLDVDRGYDFSPPTRDSNLPFVSLAFGDYQQDWDFLVNWYQDVIHHGMTTDEKVRAIVQKIYDSLTLANPPEGHIHPVDIILSGKGVCADRATLFEYLMSTLGLPSRGAWLMAPLDARLSYNNVSNDPLGYTDSDHYVAEVFYDGKWHFYNTNWGMYFDRSIVEVIADPTIQPVLVQPAEPPDPKYFSLIQSVIFHMDVNQWRYSGTAMEIVHYTPLTAPTLYGDSLPSYPFKLQARRPGFAPDERVLPIKRFYRYNTYGYHQLQQGETLRQEIRLSALEGIDRLSNQVLVKWYPADGAAGLALLLTVNGHPHRLSFDIEPEAPDWTPLILAAPADDLAVGPNTIDIQLDAPGTLRLANAFVRIDADLLFAPPKKSYPADPAAFEQLGQHLFWQIDLVYRLRSRTAPGEVEFDFTHMPAISKTLLMLTPGLPDEVLGAQGGVFGPFNDWSFADDCLTLHDVPEFVRVRLEQQQE